LPSRSRVVRISIPASELAKRRRGPAPLPAPVEPLLWLIEDIVLLSLEIPQHKVRAVARIAARAYPRGPHSHHAAVERLQRRGLLADGRTATPAARVGARRDRVRAIVERPAAPAGRDAELLAFLAALRLLPVVNRAQHLQARLRLAAVADPPASVRALVDEFAVSTVQEFTDKVLPPLVDPVVGNLDPGWSSGVGSVF
jgi:hypothetical protein